MLVCFVSLMHLIWGAILLMQQGALDTTATSVFRHLLPNYELRAIVYIVSGLLPAVLLKWPGSIGGLFSCLPQQVLLLMSGVSAIVAINAGHYADGVPRPHLFIAMDQLVYILLALLYCFETLDRFHERDPSQ